jgi:peroxiredoxin
MTRWLARSAIVIVTVLFTCLFSQIAESQNVHVPLQQANMRRLAPPFDLSESSGKRVTLNAFRGKVLLLNFWATDCGGCRLEIPWIVDLFRIFKGDNVAVVGVSMDVSYESLKNATEGWSRVIPFIRAHRIPYTILMSDKDVETSYDIRALPVTYLIDQKGRIAACYSGLIDERNVSANIRKLLEEH